LQKKSRWILHAHHGGPMVAANRYGLFGAPVMDRTMLIQCKA